MRSFAGQLSSELNATGRILVGTIIISPSGSGSRRPLRTRYCDAGAVVRTDQFAAQADLTDQLHARPVWRLGNYPAPPSTTQPSTVSVVMTAAKPRSGVDEQRRLARPGELRQASPEAGDAAADDDGPGLLHGSFQCNASALPAPPSRIGRQCHDRMNWLLPRTDHTREVSFYRTVRRRSLLAPPSPPPNHRRVTAAAARGPPPWREAPSPAGSTLVSTLGLPWVLMTFE